MATEQYEYMCICLYKYICVCSIYVCIYIYVCSICACMYVYTVFIPLYSHDAMCTNKIMIVVYKMFKIKIK